jgi:hypothetical protein
MSIKDRRIIDAIKLAPKNKNIRTVLGNEIRWPALI